MFYGFCQKAGSEGAQREDVVIAADMTSDIDRYQSPPVARSGALLSMDGKLTFQVESKRNDQSKEEKVIVLAPRAN